MKTLWSKHVGMRADSAARSFSLSQNAVKFLSILLSYSISSFNRRKCDLVYFGYLEVVQKVWQKDWRYRLVGMAICGAMLVAMSDSSRCVRV